MNESPPMTLRAAAAVGLRIIGLWFVLQSLFSLAGLFFVHRELMAGIPGAHSRYFDGPAIVNAATDLHLHDTYYVVSHFTPVLVGVLLRLGVGLVLLFASKPLAVVVARKLGSF